MAASLPSCTRSPGAVPAACVKRSVCADGMRRPQAPSQPQRALLRPSPCPLLRPAACWATAPTPRCPRSRRCSWVRAEAAGWPAGHQSCSTRYHQPARGGALALLGSAPGCRHAPPRKVAGGALLSPLCSLNERRLACSACTSAYCTELVIASGILPATHALVPCCAAMAAAIHVPT